MRLSVFGESLVQKPILLSDFNRTSLLVYSDNQLTLLCGFVQKCGRAEYNKAVRLILSPALPDDVEIHSICVLEGGAILALSGPKTVFIVRTNTDLVQMKENSNLLKSDYFCERQTVHSASLTSRGARVVQTRWLPHTSSPSSVYLAVLFSDDVIRIYSVDGTIDEPVHKADFSSLVMSGSSGVYSENTFGLTKQLVSFDFVHSSSGAADMETIIVIDSDGDVYSCLIDLAGVCSPVPRSLPTPPDLPGDSMAILSIPHCLSDIFSVFAVLSAGNVLSHIVAIPNERGGYELILKDRVKLGFENGHMQSIRLSGRDGSYLIASTGHLFYVDISSWILTFSNCLEESSKEDVRASSTQVHELISVLGESDSENITTTPIQIAAVECSMEDEKDTMSLFITTASDHIPLVSAFMRYEMTVAPTTVKRLDKEQVRDSNDFNDQLQQIQKQKQAIPAIVANKSMSEEDLLTNMTTYIQTLMNNFVLAKKALALTISKVIDIQAEAKAMENEKNAINERLLKVFSDFLAIKNRLEAHKKRVEAVDKRLVSLTSRLAGRLPLSSQETKMLSTLKDYRKQMATYSIKLPQMSLDVGEERRSCFGPLKSFQASSNAKKFMMSTSTQEINCLVERLEALQVTYDKLEAQTTAEVAE